jgi:sugar lactone lactonase YvrE
MFACFTTRHARFPFRLAAFGLSCALTLSGCASRPPANTAGRPDGWAAPEVLVQPSSFSGVHGLAIDRQGRLLAGSVVGNAIWDVDRRTGTARPFITGDQGQADDIAVGPRGELAWTSVLMGVLHYRESDTAPIRVLAADMPSINGVAFDRRNGKLYVSQTANTGHADAVWEIDRTGALPPRLIARGIGSLNGFKVGPDGMLYGALMFRGQAARVDPADGKVTVIAEGFKVPTGAGVDDKGNMWVVDSRTGELVCIELATGRKTTIRQLKPTIDNLVISSEGQIYVSNMADNSVQVYEPATGEMRVLLEGRLSVPAGLKIEGNSLYVSDVFSLREVDVSTGTVTDVLRRLRDPEVVTPSGTGLSATQFSLASWISGTVTVVDRATRKGIATLSGLKRPYDAIPMADGSLVYLEFDAGTVTHASGTGFATRQVLGRDLGGPTQMVFAADENALYVTEAVAGKITRISLDGGAPRTVASDLRGPEGLARTSWGSIVVAEVGARRLVEIDTATGERRVVADDLPIGLASFPGAPAPYMPTGVALSADGTVYFSADLNNAIYRVRVRRL